MRHAYCVARLVSTLFSSTPPLSCHHSGELSAVQLLLPAQLGLTLLAPSQQGLLHNWPYRLTAGVVLILQA
jgi:hypothetical protein